MAKIRAVDFAEYTENCRKALIKIHKNKGLITSETMSLKSAVELTEHYPVQEYKYKPQDDIPELPDLFELIDNEPLIGEDTPVTVEVLMDTYLTQKITMSANSNFVIKTSDGAIYRNNTNSSITYTHTWDTTRDIDTSYAFKMRWIMCIGSSGTTYGIGYNQIIAKLYRNATITSLHKQYTQITRYLYLDKCIININESSVTSGRSVPSCIMVRNCSVESCNIVKNIYIRNEELINANNLIPCGSYKISGIFGISSSDLNAASYMNAYSNMYCKNVNSFSGTRALFITSDISNTSSIRIEGSSSSSGQSTIIPLNTTFTNITEDNLGNTLSIGTLYGALDLKNTINYNIKFSASSQLLANRKTMLNVLNKLKDLTGEEAKTCTFGSYNLANLTEEEIAIGTNKNWTIS